MRISDKALRVYQVSSSIRKEIQVIYREKIEFIETKWETHQGVNLIVHLRHDG